MNKYLFLTVLAGLMNGGLAAGLQGIFLHGGDCGISQLYTPNSFGSDTSEVVYTGLKSYYHSAAANFEGNIYIIGGSTGKNGHIPVADVQIYNPLTNTTTMAKPLNLARCMHTATVLGPNIIVCGGINDTLNNIEFCEAYDPVADMWTLFEQPVSHTFVVSYDRDFGASFHQMADMATARADFSGSSVANRLLACGGWDADVKTINILATCEMYDPISNFWYSYRNMTTPRQYQAIVSYMYPDFTPFTETLILGGYDSFINNSTDSVESYASYGARNTGVPLAKKCAAMVAVPVGSGDVCSHSGTVAFKSAASAIKTKPKITMW